MKVRKNKGQQIGDRIKQAEQKLKLVVERTGNMESWALETIRANKQREELTQMLTTCVTLLIKDCIGRGLSDEETAALTEALDGPPKGETDGGTAREASAGESVPAASDDRGDGGGQVGAGAPAE
jgi:hypothetical protein